MMDTGVDAVILVTSHFADKGQDARVFLDNVFTLVDRTPGIPLGTYECGIGNTSYKSKIKAI